MLFDICNDIGKLYGNGNINRVGKMITNNDTTTFCLIRWNDLVYELSMSSESDSVFSALYGSLVVERKGFTYSPALGVLHAYLQCVCICMC